MSLPTRSHSPAIPILLIICLILPAFAGFGVQTATAKAKEYQVTVAGYEMIGTVNIPTGAQFDGTEIGGLSSITYDPKRGVYYAISDDQGTIDPVRYYTLSIDVSDGQLDPGDITFLEVTTILDASGDPYTPGSLDPEGLVLTHGGQLYFSSEGFPTRIPPVDPFIKRMNLNGRQTRSLEIPDKFLPNAAGTQGVRSNLGFESLNVTPDQKTLVTAAEAALVQDGPAANVGQESFARILFSIGKEMNPLWNRSILNETVLTELRVSIHDLSQETPVVFLFNKAGCQNIHPLLGDMVAKMVVYVKRIRSRRKAHRTVC